MRRLGIYILVAVALTNMALAHKAPAYDAKDNMVRDDRRSGYAYDFENRLTKVYTDTNANGQWDNGEPVHAEYAVDALGHRAGVTIGATQTRRIYDRDDLVAEFVSSETPARIFVNGTAFPDEKVLMREVSGREHYFLLDQLGSVVGLANEQGGLAATYAYDGYGMLVAGGREGDADADGDVDLRDYLTFQTQFGSSGSGLAGDFNGDATVDLADFTRFAAAATGPVATPIDTPFGFTGQGIDRLAGGQLVLYDYKGREYNPRLGRFLQRDPSGPADSYNLYEYVKSRPTTARDPSGRFSFVGLGWSMGIGALLGSVTGAISSPQGPLKGALLGAASGAAMGAAGSVSAFWFSAYGLWGSLAVGGFTGAVGGVSHDLLEGDRDLASLAVDAAISAGIGAATGGLVHFGSQAIQSLLQRVGIGNIVGLDPSKLNHIFNNPQHGLGPLVNQFGSQEAAYYAMQQATEAAARAAGTTSIFELVVQVGGQSITVRGIVVDGVVKIGTAFK